MTLDGIDYELVWDGSWDGAWWREYSDPIPVDITRPEATKALRAHLSKYAQKVHAVRVLAPRLGLTQEVVRDRLRHLIARGEVAESVNAEGHLVYQWAGTAARVYRVREVDKRVRLQGAA